MEEESNNPENLKASVEMLKNLKPGDIDEMLQQMDNMPAAQRSQLEAMGMNPDLMRKTVEMMKTNPEMAKQMSKMMENMTPDEVMEKSRQAQASFETSRSSATVASTVMDAKVADDDEDEDADPVPPPDAEVLDTLYRTAEVMSSPPTGGVTFAGFSAIPPVALLVGNDKERDLSKEELRESWAEGSLGSTRVDRTGFERVWNEVQEYFSLPIMDKARERTVAKKRGNAVSTTPTPVVSPTPVVGAAVSDEQLERVKNMSNSDMDTMLGQMENLTPAAQAQMNAMGVDPQMMQKTAAMMKSNPLMKNAAKMMMQNMSAEDMKKASQSAQEQLLKMTDEEKQEAIKRLEDQAKK